MSKKGKWEHIQLKRTNTLIKDEDENTDSGLQGRSVFGVGVLGEQSLRIFHS